MLQRLFQSCMYQLVGNCLELITFLFNLSIVLFCWVSVNCDALEAVYVYFVFRLIERFRSLVQNEMYALQWLVICFKCENGFYLILRSRQFRFCKERNICKVKQSDAVGSHKDVKRGRNTWPKSKFVETI